VEAADSVAVIRMFWSFKQLDVVLTASQAELQALLCDIVLYSTHFTVVAFSVLCRQAARICDFKHRGIR